MKLLQAMQKSQNSKTCLFLPDKGLIFFNDIAPGDEKKVQTQKLVLFSFRIEGMIFFNVKTQKLVLFSFQIEVMIYLEIMGSNAFRGLTPCKKELATNRNAPWSNVWPLIKGITRATRKRHGAGQ